MKKIITTLLVFAALAGIVQAQTFVLISVAESNKVVGGTNTYYPTTNLARNIRGRVTTPFLSKSGYTEFFIQDTSTGIRVYCPSNSFCFLETNSTTFKLGVEVTVQESMIKQINGMRYIQPTYYDGDAYSEYNDFYISNPTPNLIVPRLLSIPEYFADGELREGDLIKITNLTSAVVSLPYAPTQNTRFYATNIANGVTNRIQIDVGKDTDIAGQLAPTNAFDLIGIASQYDTNSVMPSNGYQIIAFSYNNIIQHGLGQEVPQLVVSPSSASVKVGRQLNVNVIGQDRNASDVLTLTTNKTIAGATFKATGARSKVFSWIPQGSDAGNIYTAEFAVTDGVYTNTAQLVVTVAMPYPAGYAWINEIHYDNAGADVNEGVEVAGAAGIDLTQYSIVLYNGSGNGSYSTTLCSGTIDDEGNGYGAVWFGYPANGVQNGAPDGIALVHNTYGLLDFISYEGGMVATNGAAAGIASFDIGVLEDGSILGSPVDYSLQLIGDGTNYEAFAWTGPIPHTRDNLNSPDQTVGGAVDASVSFANLRFSPRVLFTNTAFNIVCQINPNSAANTLNATAYYTLNGGTTNSMGMTPTENNYFETASQISAKPAGTVIRYWVGVTFLGDGSNSPSYSVTNIYNVVDLAGCETFENYSVTLGSYVNGTFTGQDGSTWSYTQCRGDVQITDETPCLGTDRTPAAAVESGTIAGGCGILRFDIKQGFTKTYKLGVYVNNNFITNIIGGTADVVDSSGDIAVNVAGDFVLKFLQPTGAGQVCIDNITWTAPDLSLPALYITNPVMPSLSVPNAISSYTVQGTALNVIGLIRWTNTLTKAGGTFAVSSPWGIGVGLNVGANMITVSATNGTGDFVSDNVTIIRAPPPADSDLLISEVADPSTNANAKFVEIYNAGDVSVNLSVDTYYLARQANGNTGSWDNVRLTNGAIAAGGTYVVALNASNFFEAYGFEANQANAAISGNGNDGYFLFKDGRHTNGSLVDAYGIIDEDGTGKAWDYMDAVAYRNSDVTQPNTLWSVDEWTIIKPGNPEDATPGSHMVTYGAEVTNITLNAGTKMLTFKFFLEGTNAYTLQRSTNLLMSPPFVDVLTGLNYSNAVMNYNISGDGPNSYYRLMKQ